METSQPLSIESFSHSWLANLKPSLESLENSLRSSLDASDEASFIEMDPKMSPSKRLFKSSYDFKFDFPISKSPPLDFVHADELFSNGYVMPVFIDPSKIRAYEVSDSTSTFPPSHEPKVAFSAAKNNCSSLRRCRRLSKQIFEKYLDFLRPLFRRVRGQRSSSRVESIGSAKVEMVKSQIQSAATSPRTSVTYLVDEWGKSLDSDSSIYEAVLHCKRSIGK